MKKTDKKIKENIEFWKDLVYTKGKLDEKKVMNELSDYSFMLEEVPKVYMAVAGLSKPNYYADTIITEFEDRNYDKDCIQSDIKDMIKRCKTYQDLKEELQEYFNL